MRFKKSEPDYFKKHVNKIYEVYHHFNTGNNFVFSYYKGVVTFTVRFKGHYYGITNAKQLTSEEREAVYAVDTSAYPRSSFYGFKKRRYLPNEVLFLHS